VQDGHSVLIAARSIAIPMFDQAGGQASPAHRLAAKEPSGR
jgi:hypothetical protein